MCLEMVCIYIYIYIYRATIVCTPNCQSDMFRLTRFSNTPTPVSSHEGVFSGTRIFGIWYLSIHRVMRPGPTVESLIRTPWQAVSKRPKRRNEETQRRDPKEPRFDGGCSVGKAIVNLWFGAWFMNKVIWGMICWISSTSGIVGI